MWACVLDDPVACYRGTHSLFCPNDTVRSRASHLEPRFTVISHRAQPTILSPLRVNMLIPRSIETQTLNMERDPETGRKLINQYLVSR